MRWLDEENEDDQSVPPSALPGPHRLNEEEQMGEWANLEVSFAYRAQPSSSSARSKAKNANLLVHLHMGMNGFFGAPIRTPPPPPPSLHRHVSFESRFGGGGGGGGDGGDCFLIGKKQKQPFGSNSEASRAPAG